VTAIGENRRRQVVPRWRPWLDTVKLGQVAMPGKRLTIHREPVIERLLLEYKTTGHIGLASEIVSAALVDSVDSSEVESIARELASTASYPLMRQMAELLLDVDFGGLADPAHYDGRIRISKLKGILADEPRNSVRWVDLAREYLIMAQYQQSQSAMRIALALAPHNRFVVRSASAMYAQLQEFDLAIDVIRSSPSYRHDPWLLAALVAISDLSDSRQLGMREARRTMEADISQAQLSELRAAVGTVEFRSGSSRKGRQLLRRSTKDGSENSLAQVEWIAHDSREVLLDHLPTGVPRAYEALARRASSSANWERAIQHAMDWTWDQQFATEPRSFSSSCACAWENWSLAVELAEGGLVLHPDQPVLLNNRAFALIQLGDLRGALIDLVRARSVDAHSRSKIVLAATEACLFYRAGMPATGRRRYQQVIAVLNRRQERILAAKAALMLSREEYFAGSYGFQAAWHRAEELMKYADVPEIRDLYNRIEESIGSRSPSPHGSHSVVDLAPLVPEPEALAPGIGR